MYHPNGLLGRKSSRRLPVASRLLPSNCHSRHRSRGRARFPGGCRRPWREAPALSTASGGNGAHVPILNHAVAALGFFFKVTLRCSDIIEHTTFIHELRRLTVVLSPEEVARHLGCGARAQMQGGAERGLWRRLARRQYLKTFTRTDVPRVPRRQARMPETGGGSAPKGCIVLTAAAGVAYRARKTFVRLRVTKT